MKLNILVLSLFTLLQVQNLWAQPTDLDLEDPEDLDVLMEDLKKDKEKDPNLNKEKMSEKSARLSEEASLEEEIESLDFDETAEKDTKGPKDTPKEKTAGKEDDLDSLMQDIGDIEFTLPAEEEAKVKEVEEVEKLEAADAAKDAEEGVVTEGEQKTSEKKPEIKIVKDAKIVDEESAIIHDVGKLEKDLLEMAKKMQGKIPNDEWNEIAGSSAGGTYEVVAGDWLWKISKNIFGSGFYYSKIWALNPYITNPHEIEPGMILSFSTGSDNNLPSLDLARARKKLFKSKDLADEFERWGDDAKPKWMDEREKLKEEGVYLQYATGDTEKDLKEIGEQSLIKEYETYEPPKPDFIIAPPEEDYDAKGIDKNAKVEVSYSEGFYLNTFVSSNIVQDFGKFEAAIKEKSFFGLYDTIYIRFDEKIDVVPGDKFSVYNSQGMVTHKNSDRRGFKYTIGGSFEAVQKQHNGLWEARIIETSEMIQRGDRVTVYTPKIDRITQSFNQRVIEAVIFGTYYDKKRYASLGDVIYLDRGRADGVEVGNIFEVYGFKDRGTGLKISENPTYKSGELTVLTVTDNFSTALVTNSFRDFEVGDIAVTKTKEAAARATRIKDQIAGSKIGKLGDDDLDELDVELNLDDLNDSLLDKADKIQFTEDELAELERQEREKSVLTENEKDLRALERLESELETAEKMLNEARLDEDKLLENEDLDKTEKNFGVDQQESLDELEENFGKRYLDEDLNDKENPYGLTEYDIEEIDELLNIDKEESSQNATQ